MRRREFIALLGSAVATLPVAVQAQETKPARLGFLITDSLQNPQVKVGFDALQQGLRKLGYIDGQNITIEYREAGNRFERFPDLVNDLLGLHVDVIVVPNSAWARSAQRVTRTVPIVVAAMGDPVRDGLVASLARPGGNITGSTFLGQELVPKRLALLREILPSLSRVAGLWHPDAYGESTTNNMFSEAARVVGALRLHLEIVRVLSQSDLARAFNSITAEALIQFPSPMFYNARKEIVDLAAKHRLPAIYVDRAFVEVGGLMGYGTSIIELLRHAATYVHKILKGAQPSELPVEQPTKFELAINLQTARSLGLNVPPPLLARADVLVE